MKQPPTPPLPQPILLVGYTARLLAELAARAGYAVAALDYFGDADLRALCPSQSLLRDFGGRAYSAAALAEAARGVKAPAVVYGASFENHPELVAMLADGRLLLGNSPATLARVRDPHQLAAAVRAGGFQFPATRSASDPPPDRRGWLWKPLHSGGGHGVRRWRGGSAPTAGILQAHLNGLAGSAAFVADGQRAVVLGLTEQLVGRRAFGATGFRYCGNLTPPRLPPAELAALAVQAQAIANHLTAVFGLRGLNGLDFVWHRQQVWTLEVNPRPSASLELFDAARPGSVFEAHVRACRGELPGTVWPWRDGRARGKAVLFAGADVQVGDTHEWHQLNRRDIPHTGERIGRGHPICTLLAEGATPSACLTTLQRHAAAVRHGLTPAPSAEVST